MTRPKIESNLRLPLRPRFKIKTRKKIGKEGWNNKGYTSNNSDEVQWRPSLWPWIVTRPEEESSLRFRLRPVSKLRLAKRKEKLKEGIRKTPSAVLATRYAVKRARSSNKAGNRTSLDFWLTPRWRDWMKKRNHQYSQMDAQEPHCNILGELVGTDANGVFYEPCSCF